MTTKIPIIVATGVDLVQAVLALSLAKPGGYVTGLSILGPELITKRLEILREVIPKLHRVGVLMRAGAGSGTGQQQQMDEIRAAASALKIPLFELPSEMEFNALDRAFKKAADEGVSAIIPTAGRQTLGARKSIAEAAIKYRIPNNLSGARIRRCRRTHILRTEFLQSISPCCLLRGQNL